MSTAAILLQARCLAWLKGGRGPLARRLKRLALGLRSAQLPPLPVLHPLAEAMLGSAAALGSALLRATWWLPLFQTRLTAPAPRLRLDGRGMPQILGPLRLTIGADSRIATATTFTARPATAGEAANTLRDLVIGRNVDIGWQTTIAVGSAVWIADDVRLAARVFLAGYPGHPLDPAARAAGAPDQAEQARPISIGRGAWLGTGVIVLAGVSIGDGTVVGAGAVVTRSLPARVLAAGNPARVIRPIDQAHQSAPVTKPLAHPQSIPARNGVRT